MNNLEWIDFEINFCKQKINKLKGEILYQKSMAILLPENNINLTLVNEFELSLNEEKINHLQQIKCEIEAWESVKELIINSNGVYLLRVDSDDEDDQEHYKRIEKALEVKNETN